MSALLFFWSSVALIFYAYVGYPVALAVLRVFRSRAVIKGDVRPRVSFIITARNEEARIAGKIENTLGQDYPREAIEIIVASDCSTDRTDEIVSRYPDVRLVRAPHRLGKEGAQQIALQEASGQVMVFSDVATALAPDGVSRIVRNFADPTVGCVSSVDRTVDADGTISGEGLYVRYEMWLRALETNVRSLVGLSGSFFAARREVCQRWDRSRQSDFNTVLNAVDMRLRGVLDPDSVGYYRNVADTRGELQRKIRTVVRGIWVLAGRWRMLNPFRHGLFAWQLASHKLCRWLVPFAMIVAAVSNAFLAPRSPFYAATLLAQSGLYAAALGGLWTRSRVLRIPAFLFLANVGVLMAWFRAARGERMTMWDPSDRPATLPGIGRW